MPRSTQAAQRFSERGEAIVTAARQIAESEGWPAVTVRRLADTIGFSQPMLYKHFPSGRDQIVEQVVLQGFGELAEAMRAAVADGDALPGLVTAYLDYARAHPATIEAMSTALTSIPFASDDTPAPLLDGFETIRRCVEVPDARLSTVRAELLWSVLHGVGELSRFGRLPADLEADRIAEIVRLFRAENSNEPGTTSR